MTARPLDQFSIGVVLERRDTDNRWIDHTWHVAEVIAGAPDGPARPLETGEGWARFYVGATTVELFDKATEGYKRNLTDDRPSVYVVLRPDDGEPPYQVFLATVCPYEAEAYDGADDDSLVAPAALPVELVARVQAFVDAHHVDQPFIKRKQKRKDGTEDHG